MAEPFAGVSIPNESTGSETAPETNLTNSGAPDTQADTSTQTPSPTDLDKLERVRFGGKEYSTKELRDSFMRQSDYSKKTKELAETRKYADNFAYDFAKVVRNPSLVSQFKAIYPQQYHQLLEDYLKDNGHPETETANSNEGQNLPPEVRRALEDRFKQYDERLQKIDAWEANVKEQETRAIGEQLDALHDRFGKKYPYADPDLVDFRVQLAKEKGVDINKDNLAQAYEQVYKALHETQSSRLSTQQKTKVQEQVKAGRESKDVGGGVGTPAAAPKKYSKFAEINKDVFSAFGGK